MNRTRWNDDLETWCDERYYRKDEVDEMINRLELNSGLVFSVEVEDEIFSVDDGVQEFRANLSYANGAGVDGKGVLFSLVDGNGNSVDTSLVTTDVDGYAVYEYTPTGRGQVFVTASYGTLLQETFVVYDCILAYDGTSSPIPAIIQKSNNTYVSMVADNNGLTLSNSHSSSIYYVGLDKEASSGSIGDWIDWKDVAFEFEYISHSGNCSVTIRPFSSTTKSYSFSNCSNGDIIRLETSNDEITIYKNGESVVEGTLTTDELVSMRLNINASSNVTIKNLKLYSI